MPLRARPSIALAAVLTAPLWPSTAHAGVHHTYATSYCLNGTMADGSTVRMRSAASDWLPLGTHIRLIGRPFLGGLRRFVIRDTGPALSDGHLDIWHPSCSASVAWGARPVRFKLGWGKP
jgi:3D (Asp-Asp-Asp) domain-containing protein